MQRQIILQLLYTLLGEISTQEVRAQHANCLLTCREQVLCLEKAGLSA